MKNTSTKLQTNLNDRNSKFKTVRLVLKYQQTDQYVSEIGFSDLDIICNLGIGIWNFRTVSGKENRLLLNQQELTLSLPCFPRELIIKEIIIMLYTETITVMADCPQLWRLGLIDNYKNR